MIELLCCKLDNLFAVLHHGILAPLSVQLGYWEHISYWFGIFIHISTDTQATTPRNFISLQQRDSQLSTALLQFNLLLQLTSQSKVTSHTEVDHYTHFRNAHFIMISQCIHLIHLLWSRAGLHANGESRQGCSAVPQGLAELFDMHLSQITP